MVFYVNLNIGKIKYIFYLFLFSSPLRLKKRKKNVEKNAILKIKINIFTWNTNFEFYKPLEAISSNFKNIVYYKFTFLLKVFKKKYIFSFG